MHGLVESGGLTTLQLRSRDVHTFHLCDTLTGFLIYFMLLFSPWAFGTTEPWSIWTMNACGYLLGFLLIVKLFIRSFRGYPLARGGNPDAEKPSANPMPKVDRGPADRCTCARQLFNPVFSTRALGLCTCMILGYCLLSALNARATYNPSSLTFEYHAHISWLPASLDRTSTLQAFWNLLALACSFWAVRDWLHESSSPNQQGDLFESPSKTYLPNRLVCLLWILSFSGGLLAVEGTMQRVLRSGKLLFLVTPAIHREPLEQFASFAYRATAAQYFNLLWPTCLGFWWVTCRAQGRGSTKHLLLACAGIMAACPFISAARGAAVVDLALLLIATSMLLLYLPRTLLYRTNNRPSLTVLVLLFFVGSVVLGLSLGCKQFLPRMHTLAFGFAERERLYEFARRIAADYPLFGTGPGTFEKVFQLYRGSSDAYWPAQLHNDWLETRVTFGWAGSVLIAVALLILFLTSINRRRSPSSSNALRPFLWLSLAGCLVQARWDFPLQIYSILFLAVIWCSVIFATPPGRQRRGLAATQQGLNRVAVSRR